MVFTNSFTLSFSIVKSLICGISMVLIKTPVFFGNFIFGGCAVVRYDEVKNKCMGNLSASFFNKYAVAGLAFPVVFPILEQLSQRHTMSLSSGIIINRMVSLGFSPKLFRI